MSLWEQIKQEIVGRKTYIVAVALICWAAGGMVAQKMSVTAGIEAIMIALGMMGIRHGLETKKIEQIAAQPPMQ